MKWYRINHSSSMRDRAVRIDEKGTTPKVVESDVPVPVAPPPARVLPGMSSGKLMIEVAAKAKATTTATAVSPPLLCPPPPPSAYVSPQYSSKERWGLGTTGARNDASVKILMLFDVI